MPEIYEEKKAPHRKFYLKFMPDENEEGTNDLVIVDEDGKPQVSGCILTIRADGMLELQDFVDADAARFAGIALDKNGKVKIYK